jgi:two-component system nitrogen regulation sensor histidine kinase NtrY
MTNGGQTVTAELATAAAPTPGRLARLIGVIAVALALLSALATFMVLANLTPILPTHEVVLTLLLVNAFTVLFLLAIITREVWRVFQARRRGRAGARLHVRIVALFSVIAAVPAILVAVVASVTLDRGLDRLFSRQTRSLIENSLIVAEAYMREQAQFIRADTIATSIELARAKPLFDQNREQFHQFLQAQASIRGLPAVTMLDNELNVIDQAVAQSTRPSSSRRARRSRASTMSSRRLRSSRCQLSADHQAAALRQLSLCCAPARPTCGRAIAADPAGVN